MNQYTPEQRIFKFWSKAAITADSNKCWNWLAGKNNHGYGNVRYNKVCDKAHRVAWRLTYGEIPDGLYVCHKCDNPSCINPNHLWLGTHLDNMIDRDRKGRNAPPYGEKQGGHKLTTAQVISIRKRFAAGGISKSALGREYGVSNVQICNIVNGKQRNHEHEALP